MHHPDVDNIVKVVAALATEMPDRDFLPFEIAAWTAKLARVVRRMHREIGAELGLAAGDVQLLVMISEMALPRGVKPTELAGWTGLTTGALTGQVDRLIAMGLVTREHVASDRRSREIRLTEAGSTAADRVIERICESPLGQVVAALPVRRREQLRRLLEWVDPEGVVPQNGQVDDVACILRLIRRIAARAHREAAVRFSPLGILPGDSNLLVNLFEQGAPYELSPSELAKLCMAPMGAITSRTDRLVRSGLVERERSATDRRRVAVRLTKLGLTHLQQISRAVVDSEFSQAIVSLDSGDQRDLAFILRMIDELHQG